MLIVILIALMSFSGCGLAATSSLRQENEKNRSTMLLVDLGMSKAEILKLMGTPRLTEAYTLNGKAVIMWFYLAREQGIAQDEYRFSRHELTPIVFEDGNVVGWGGEFVKKYDHRIKADIKVK